ncbi:MAG: 16S rRNA (cytidine(1402)-2'-O)-methyltransferase [Bacillota bacterium]
MEGSYHVYMVRCADGTLYSGITADLERRLAEHNGGRGSRYTRARTPVTLVWCQAAGDRAAAQRLEAKLKRSGRAAKEKLIGGPPQEAQPSPPQAAAGGGTLYLVATPIGNLGDITLRALEVLRSAAVVLAEDTRHTRKLTAHYGLTARLVSYHRHNEVGRKAQVLAWLRAGQDIALVSDAGMPGVADPGEAIVAATVAEGLRVVPVPGPSAVTAALAASGLPTAPFTFTGFLPRGASSRRRLLERLLATGDTLVCFEAPHRLGATLTELAALAPDRRAAVARELTKAHEEFVRGTVRDICDHFAAQPPRGELTLVIGPGAAAAAGPVPILVAAGLQAEVDSLISGGATRAAALRAVAGRYGLSRKELYARLLAPADD